MTHTYLDHAATTTVRPSALEAMRAAYEGANANASGLHTPARSAKNAMEEAREQAAEMLGVARPLDIIFTSGGTEADNLAVVGSALVSDRRSIVVSAIEHEAVLRAAEHLGRFGYMTAAVPVDRDARVDVDEVLRVIGPDTAVVSIMAANNEIGTIQPVASITQAVRTVDPAIRIHTDAVQAFVAEDITMATTGADLVSLAAHKFGGPKGVGLLAVGTGVELDPVLHGGGQEAGRRSGTYNVPGIVGMVAAMTETVQDRARFRSEVGGERDAFESTIADLWPTAVVNGRGARRLAQHSHIQFPGVLAETLLIRLDQAGMAAAAGSACQSGAVEPSHVLTAMGFDEVSAGECVRFTFGWDTRPGTGADAAKRVVRVLEDLT
jgi:cysteine desulfurase